MTGRTSRIIAVTAGLTLVGSACGGALGFALASIPMVGEFAPPDAAMLMRVGALGGAVFGGLVVPTVAWARFRSLPFGQLVRELAIGVVIGAAITWIVRPEWTPVGAVAGFLFGVRRLHRAMTQRASPHA